MRPFDNAVCVLNCFSPIRLIATLWTVAHQTPLFIGLSQQEWWSGVPFPTPEDLPDPGIKPPSLASPALESRFYTTNPPGKPLWQGCNVAYSFEVPPPKTPKVTFWSSSPWAWWKNKVVLGDPRGSAPSSPRGTILKSPIIKFGWTVT